MNEIGRTVGRRRLLTVGAGALGLGAIATSWPNVAAAGPNPKPPNYEAMLLMCIDPRFVHPTNQYMLGRGLMNRYSQFGLAGAAAGAVAPRPGPSRRTGRRGTTRSGTTCPRRSNCMGSTG